MGLENLQFSRMCSEVRRLVTSLGIMLPPLAEASFGVFGVGFEACEMLTFAHTKCTHATEVINVDPAGWVGDAWCLAGTCAAAKVSGLTPPRALALKGQGQGLRG